MNGKPATVPFAPRSTSNCLDLAVLFSGRRISTFLTLWACAALPGCGLVYVLSDYYEFDLRLALLVIYLATALLGGWLIAAVTPGLFQQMVHRESGEPSENRPSPAAGYLGFAACLLTGGLLALILAPKPLLDEWGAELSLTAAILLSVVMFARAALLVREQGQGQVRLARPLTAALAMRVAVGLLPGLCLLFPHGFTLFLACVLAVFPGLLLAARNGFAAERACVTQLDPRLHDGAADELIQRQLSDLLLRLCGIGMFFLLLWGVLYCTLELLLGLLFQSGILISRLAEVDLGTARFWHFLTHDPRLLTALTATALLAYPIARFAWFLCYIDLRVRRDCWDLELALAAEADRLRETA